MARQFGMTKDNAPHRSAQPPTIVDSLIQPRQLPIIVPFAISGDALTEATPVFVQLRDERGNTGLGECSPFPSLTGDTQHVAREVAQETIHLIRGLDPLRALELLHGHRSEIVNRSITAFVGVETALLDLHARQLGIPLTMLFGVATRSAVESDITLPVMPTTEVDRFWTSVRDIGFRVVKVKVKGNLSHDLDTIHELERVASPGIRISLDGNQGYELDNAVRLIDRLRDQRIVPLCFEQPLAADDLDGLAKLSARIPIPVCLDESVKCTADLINIRDKRVATAINLKIMKSGVIETLNMARVAKALGIRLMIGGMLETEVAMGVSLAIACGTDAIEWIDLDTPFFLRELPTVESPWHGRNAELTPRWKAGHGMDLRTNEGNAP